MWDIRLYVSFIFSFCCTGATLTFFLNFPSFLAPLNSNLENCFIISSEYADTVPSGTTNYYEPVLTASIPDGYKLFGITGLRASLASIYFYSSGRRLTYNQIQIGLRSVNTSDLSGVVYLYRFIFIKENIISIHWIPIFHLQNVNCSST